MTNKTMRLRINTDALVARIKAELSEGGTAVVPDGVTVEFENMLTLDANHVVCDYVLGDAGYQHILEVVSRNRDKLGFPSMAAGGLVGAPAKTSTVDLVTRNAAGLTKPSAKKLAAKVLRDDGCSYDVIARALGVSKTDAARLVKGAK